MINVRQLLHMKVRLEYQVRFECTSSVRLKLMLPRNIFIMKEEISRCFHF